jgi:hypothetical protein
MATLSHEVGASCRWDQACACIAERKETTVENSQNLIAVALFEGLRVSAFLTNLKANIQRCRVARLRQ